MSNLSIKRGVAKIENDFFKAQFNFTSREQKVLLFLISCLDPLQQDDFFEQTVPIKVLASVLKTDKSKQWGGIYDAIKELGSRMVKLHIDYLTPIKLKGKKMYGHIPVFRRIEPLINEQNEICLMFKFNEDMKPLLLGLREFVQIDLKEIAPMQSGYAIHLFMVLKSERRRRGAYGNVTKVRYELNDLKGLLGIKKNKYKGFDNFRRRVLETVIKQINLPSSSIKVWYEKVKEGRSVKHIDFFITDKDKQQDFNISKEKSPKTTKNKSSKKETPQSKITKSFLENNLTRAQLRAYRILVNRDIFEEIAYKEIIATIPNGRVKGVEDFFIEAAIKYFEKVAEIKTMKNFVIWWRKGIFTKSENGGVKDKIEDIVYKRWKKLEKEDLDAFLERDLSKDISYSVAQKKDK